MKRPIDWPAVIDQLLQADITQQTISTQTGISARYLADVRREVTTPRKEWNEALELLDLYVKHIGLPVPFVGDYYEINHEK